ncbi:MAG: hypothetical protein SO063_09455 [Eubacteriales bacterium]|nr:hypothetical protein [Eubacteriales bacterium]
MRNWKKYAGLLLALVMCLSLAACGSKEETVPDTIKELALNASVEYDYSPFMGTWEGEDGSVLVMEHLEELYNSERFRLHDADNKLLASGSLQYVENYKYVYAYNEHDGIAHRCWFGSDGTLFIDTFGTFGKVSGDAPGETIGSTTAATHKQDEVEELPDISGFVGYWKMVDAPFYFLINDAYEWAAVNVYNEEMGPGYVVAEGDFITLCLEDGSEVISLWKESDDELSDEEGNTFRAVDDNLLLPTPDDDLDETAYFPDGFTNVSIDYPIQMEANPHPDYQNALSFDAIMKDVTEDCYSNITIAFLPISGYDSYMEKGAAIAKPNMIEMLDQFMKSIYGDKLLKSFGCDFMDNGDYYSLTGYMWLDGSVFPDGPSQPLRGCMEVRYYGPTSYALVATTIAPESRIRNYFDICNNMLETLSYTADWSTAPKARPEQPEQPEYSGDTGDYGVEYYWYDEDGDIWVWNGYENEFVCFGSDGYIDEDTGEYMESNDAGWDYDDMYYDDYDPWSDPGDTWLERSEPDDGWGDYFGD